MNQYGQMAAAHWQRWLPSRLATIPPEERNSYFSTLGQQVADRIDQLAAQFAGDDPAGETFLEKTGRLSNARQRARELVLAEEVLLDPEPGTDPDEDQERQPESTPISEGWAPMVEDPEHPFWQAVREQEDPPATSR